MKPEGMNVISGVLPQSKSAAVPETYRGGCEV